MRPPAASSWVCLLLLLWQPLRGLESQPALRGTWLTTTANDHLHSAELIDASLTRLVDIGCNTVYIESWKNGYTQFPSAVLQATIGVDRHPELGRNGRPDDLLEATVLAAQRRGLLAVAWFEYGFMAAWKDTDNELRRHDPTWLSRDRDGGVVAPNGFVWLNPLHPDVQDLIIGLLLEAVDRYDLDGVQLDDRLAWPHVEMGYDDYTVARYQAEHDGRSPPDNPREKNWMRWRSEQVDAVGLRIATALRQARPSLLVSLSPAIAPWAYDYYLLDWPAWVDWTDADDRPLWDTFIPQCYRGDLAAFRQVWRQQRERVHAIDATYGGLAAGILATDTAQHSITWEELHGELEQVRQDDEAGQVLWYSRGVLEQFEEPLREYFTNLGPAHHPLRPIDWRPPALPCSHIDAGNWRLPENIPAGNYRVIGRASSSDAWQKLEQILIPGPATISVATSVTEVELLLDRRHPPQFDNGPSIDPDPVTGIDASLSVTASDPDGDDLALRYAWQVTDRPAASDAPTIDDPTSTTTTIRFSTAGDYQVGIRITDDDGLQSRATVAVTVSQQASSVNVDTDR